MTLEKLEEIREKIDKVQIFIDGVIAHKNGIAGIGEIKRQAMYNAQVFKEFIDAAIAEERAESARPEPGDVVALVDKNGNVFVESFGGYGAYEPGTRFVVLMRAADVRRKIEGASS